ncbi:MAG: response regulator [Spirochaetales bacterium]|nr:response regulator [Spirochaetales bacterium]
MKDEINKGKGRILLMDDDDMVRRVSGKILEHLGYEVLPAEEGRKAIEIYQKAMDDKNPVDVVLLDLTVPGGMSGQETFVELIKIDKNVKAVICSGYSSDPVISQYKDAGFKAVVQKPYTVEKLNFIISQVISEP